jgi:ABC-type cobalt transport system substrate-binding protein
MAQHIKRLRFILLAVVAILLVPLVAMQFTTAVDWGLADFIIAGILLVGTGLLIEVSLRKIKHANYRFLVILVILIVFLLVWAELAVGIFGTPFEGS